MIQERMKFYPLTPVSELTQDQINKAFETGQAPDGWKWYPLPRQYGLIKKEYFDRMRNDKPTVYYAWDIADSSEANTEENA